MLNVRKLKDKVANKNSYMIKYEQILGTNVNTLQAVFAADGHLANGQILRKKPRANKGIPLNI
jgi:hypothetical protein